MNKVENLIPAGDLLQSAASRMVEWIERHIDHGCAGGDVPYEVRMAALEAKSAVEGWTKARTPTKPQVEVYAREECIFNYCPYPDTCKARDACEHYG